MEIIQQPILPGLEDHFAEPERLVEEPFCGYFIGDGTDAQLDFLKKGCDKDPNLMAIWFIMEKYTRDHTRNGTPQRLFGLDKPFAESERIYSCSPTHLIKAIKYIEKNELCIAGHVPEVIVGRNMEIDEQAMVKVYDAFGIKVDDPCEFKPYSHGRDTLGTLWHREGHLFKF